jgi:phosphate starvation-inducible protein PhoH and related proteins
LVSECNRAVFLENNDYIPALFGVGDKHLKQVENTFHVKISTQENQINIKGKEADVVRVEKLIKDLYSMVTEGYSFQDNDLKFILRVFTENKGVDIKNIFSERIEVPSKKRYITPKSVIQKKYVEAIRENDIVFGIGPAGTGKTYLAMAMGVFGLTNKQFSRIILARPAVEAGEKLGFLPGDLYEKVNPYLRPLYDALYDMIDFDKAQRFIERGLIEIAPIAYMRGRTLNDSFIILDEAQNVTSEQMKMFLTRIGFNSKTIITGDITQVDLLDGKISGLVEVQEILRAISDIKFIYFSEKDVVRHDLVQHIIKAYESHESKNHAKNKKGIK